MSGVFEVVKLTVAFVLSPWNQVLSAVNGDPLGWWFCVLFVWVFKKPVVSREGMITHWNSRVCWSHWDGEMGKAVT